MDFYGLVNFTLGMCFLYYNRLILSRLGRVRPAFIWNAIGAVFLFAGALEFGLRFSVYAYIIAKWWLIYPLLAVMFFFMFVEALIIDAASGSGDPESRYAVVPGSALFGAKISLNLKNRLVAAEAYMKRYPGAVVVVAGGRGPDELVTEAEAMKKYLVGQGISESRILEEKISRTTYENISNALDLIQENFHERPDRLTVISSDFHLFRASLICRRLGVATVRTWPAWVHPLARPTFFMREFFAVIKSFFSDRPKEEK